MQRDVVLLAITCTYLSVIYILESCSSCSMSSETSSFNSECQDDEEIALAMQAAEIANRNEARAKFRCVCLFAYFPKCDVY